MNSSFFLMPGRLAALIIFFASDLFGEDIPGKVVSVSGDSVELRVEGKLVPQAGDPVTLSFEIPGSGTVPLRGTWKVKSVAGDLVRAGAEGKASGAPQAGYRAVIQSKSPQKIAARATPTPPPAAAPPKASAPPVRTRSRAELFRKVNLQQFVMEHHQALLDRDFTSFMGDYASKVAWTNKGTRGRDFIRQDYERVLREWPQMEMTVGDPFSISKGRRSNERKITYRLRCDFSNQKTKKRVRRHLEITMRVLASGGRLRITSEKHVVLSKTP